MKVCVIGGANVDITATSGAAFRIGDSNPGIVRVSWGGVARNIAHNLSLLGDRVELLTILAGIVHAGANASVERAAKAGLECARCAVESPDAVSSEIKKLKI